MAEWVDWNGKLTPSTLVEHLRDDAICPECGGLGLFPEPIDDDRFPVMVPCHRCRIFCDACQRRVARNHICERNPQ